MGVNGAGKSTLLKLVAGASEPDDGTVARGPSVKMGYFAQHAMELLDGDRTVLQSLEDSFPQAGQAPLRALAGCFGFSGDEIEKKCRVLSGGEKARLVMAKMLFDPPNFLVLDEPTNHLDIATKQMLIEALSRYEGAMLFVSHDRHFLAALSNRVLELTADGIAGLWRRLHRICRAHRPGGAGPPGLTAGSASPRPMSGAAFPTINFRDLSKRAGLACHWIGSGHHGACPGRHADDLN